MDNSSHAYHVPDHADAGRQHTLQTCIQSFWRRRAARSAKAPWGFCWPHRNIAIHLGGTTDEGIDEGVRSAPCRVRSGRALRQ